MVSELLPEVEKDKAVVMIKNQFTLDLMIPDEFTKRSEQPPVSHSV